MREDIDLEAFRQRLIARQAELEAQKQGRQDDTGTVELDQTRVGRLSRMDEIQQNAMSRALKQRADQELRRIAEALEKFEHGDYGYCELCDEPIGEGRLTFDPSMPICVACAERAEQRRR